MSKYIDAEKLITIVEERKAQQDQWINRYHDPINQGISNELTEILNMITSLQQEEPPTEREIAEAHHYAEMIRERDKARTQQEQPDNMIQWTGNNLKEVIDFTGKSPKFGEWFKSWDEFESYVHSHGDILKLFSEDGSHFEVPIGAWIVKTPDGYNVPSVSRFVQEQPEVDLQKFAEKIDAWKARYNYPDNIPINAAIAFTARMFYQYPNVARRWYDSLPKATMD